MSATHTVEELLEQVNQAIAALETAQETLVDGIQRLNALDAAVVHNTGAEGVAGAKTFSDQINANGGVKINSLEVIPVANEAAAHNAVYRGKDLTSIYTPAQLATKMQNADFSDLYIGDYITKPVTISYSGTLDGETITVSVNTSFNFRIAHFDYWYYMGDTALTKHHIVFVPDIPLFNCKMRKTNTTEGGIPATNVWYLLQNQVYSALNAGSCFNGKILSFRDYIPANVNATAPSRMGSNAVGTTYYVSSPSDWRDVKCGLMHEPMAYSASPFSSSGRDIGPGKSQLALFRLDPTWLHSKADRRHFWLCAVASATSFACCYSSGHATTDNASGSHGVRPFFLIG